MATTYGGNLKKGDFILYNGEVNYVVKTEFYSPGKGSALMRTKLKNVVSGKIVDYTFKSNESVEVVDVEVNEMQYLYKDDEYLYFMDPRTYAQYQLRRDVVGEVSEFLKDGENYYVYMYEDQAINMRPPQSVVFTVQHADEAVKGDTTGNAKKPATLENGVEVMVPLFIKSGDKIKVNPETGEYVERVN